MWLSDEEYTFRQDVKEKKSIGRGAFAKKNGSKSKKCTLPYEYLTKKEREKLNGEVISFNPKAFYTYDEFKALPEEYQVKYVNSLLNRYNCSLVAISTYVFGMDRNTLNNHLRRTNQLQYVNVPKVHWRELKPGDEALHADVILARRVDVGEEIQNGSNDKQKDTVEQVQAEIHNAIEHGCHFSDKQLNDIYQKRCGMSLEEALGTVAKKEETETGVKLEAELSEKGKEFFERLERDANYPEVTREESTNVSDFYVVMDKLDFGFMASVRDMFEGKKIRVTLRVEIDE
jgi:hypothetical protein